MRRDGRGDSQSYNGDTGAGFDAGMVRGERMPTFRLAHKDDMVPGTRGDQARQADEEMDNGPSAAGTQPELWPADAAPKKPEPGAFRPRRRRLTLQQLDTHLLGAANILRGRTAGQDYKNYIL